MRVDGWEMQCCGSRFEVGDDVTWTVHDSVGRAFLAAVVGTADAARITHRGEHHSDPGSGIDLQGRVRSLWRKKGGCNRRNPPRPVPGDCVPGPGPGHREEESPRP